MAVRFYEIDGERLKKAFEDRSLVMTDVSIDMGFDRSYLSGLIYKGKIRKSSADVIEKVYGIPYEEYKPIPKMPEIPEVEDEEPLPWENPFGIIDNFTFETKDKVEQGTLVVTLSDETIEKIGKVIYEQVKKAWNE